MGTIASPANLNPLPIDQQALARLVAGISPPPSVIAPPGPAPIPRNFPGIQPSDAAAGQLRTPGIASPRMAAPAALVPQGAPEQPAPTSALQRSKDAESAIKPPNYTGKLGILEKIGDAAGRLLAPGIEQRLGVGTIGYQDRLADAEAQTDRLEKQGATEAGTAKTQADAAEAQRIANAPPPESPNVGKTVTVNGRLMQFDPKTQGYDVDLGSAKPTDDWAADPTNGVEINRTTGEIRPMTVGGKPVDLPPTPERDKQRMQTLEQSLAAGTINDADRATLRQLQSDAKLAGTKPEIIAQVGPPPVASDYPKGSADPKYKADEQAWGKAYEKVANDEASASGFAHGAGYNATRPVAVFDPATGTFVYESAQQAEQSGAAPGNLANNVMGRQAQIADIVSGSNSLRAALTAPGLAPFSPKQTAQLSLAMRDVDPGAMRNAVTDFMASGLSPQQQDLVADLFSMQERALSLRSVAGMGQGSDVVRHAIIKALPNITSGSTSLALKQLDMFDNLVGNLAKGIGGIKGSAATPAGALPAGVAPGSIKMSLGGVVHWVAPGDVAAAKKHGATEVQ